MFFGLHKEECGRVHAVAQAGRFGAIVEYMTQVGAATAAIHFGAHHAVTFVFRFFYIVFFDRLPETGPAGAAVKFGG